MANKPTKPGKPTKPAPKGQATKGTSRGRKG